MHARLLAPPSPVIAHVADRAAPARGRGPPGAQVFVYEGVGHAFMNDSPAPYESFEARAAAMGFVPFRADVADAAWARTVAFLKRHLGAA